MIYMKIPILRIPFSNDDIGFIHESIEEILKTGQLAMGKNVKAFESQFADFIGVNYAIGVNSGTSALEMILRAIDIRHCSVIVPTNTFMATATAVVHAGGKVIFCDVLKEDLCIDPDDLRRKIQKNTNVVIIVHIGGIISPNFLEIKKICDENGIYLIEDAAHAHGSTINRKKAGSLSLAAAFSFYPTKVMTCGEGGMITTDDNDLYEKMLILRDQGLDHRFNIHTEFGYNWRQSEIHAIIGLAQMKKINWILEQRRHLAKTYENKLKNLEKIKPVSIPSTIKSSYYKFICYLSEDVNRDVIKKKMAEIYQIQLPGEVYATPCHKQPVFKKYKNIMLNKKNETFPGSDFVCKNQVCLPLYPGLTKKEVEYVIESLKMVIADYQFNEKKRD